MELAKILLSLGSLVVSIIALAVAFQARRDGRRGFNAQHVPKVDFSMVNEKCDRDDKASRHLHLHCTNKSNVDAHNLNVVLDLTYKDAKERCFSYTYPHALKVAEKPAVICLLGLLVGPSGRLASDAFEFVSRTDEGQALKLKLGKANPTLQLRGRFEWDSPAVGVATSMTERVWNLEAILNKNGFVTSSWSASPSQIGFVGATENF